LCKGTVCIRGRLQIASIRDGCGHRNADAEGRIDAICCGCERHQTHIAPDCFIFIWIAFVLQIAIEPRQVGNSRYSRQRVLHVMTSKMEVRGVADVSETYSRLAESCRKHVGGPIAMTDTYFETDPHELRHELLTYASSAKQGKAAKDCKTYLYIYILICTYVWSTWLLV